MILAKIVTFFIALFLFFVNVYSQDTTNTSVSFVDTNSLSLTKKTDTTNLKKPSNLQEISSQNDSLSNSNIKDSLMQKEAKNLQKTQKILQDTAVASRPDTINYKTDKIKYDLKNKRVYFLDNNQIFYQNYSMVADSIVMDMQTDITNASKNLFLVDMNTNDTLYLDSLAFNTKNKQGLFWNLSGIQDGGLFSGEIIKREDATNYLGNNFFYTTDLDSNPAHYFYAEKLKLKTDDKVAFAKPIVMTIADVPVAPLPLFVKSYDKSRRSGFLFPSYGGSASNGREIRNIGFYWVIADNLDFEAIGDYYEKRGVGLQGRFRWKTKFYIPVADFYYKRYLNLSSTNNIEGYNDNLKVNFRANLDTEKKYVISANGSIASSKDVLEDYEDDQEERLKAQNQSINATFTAKPHDNFNLSTYVKKDANLLRKTEDFVLPSLTITSLPSIRYSTIVPLIHGKRDWFYKSQKEDLTKSKWDNVYISIGSPSFKRTEHIDDSVSFYNAKRMGYSIPLALQTKSIELGPFKLKPSLNFSHVGVGTYVDSTWLDSIVTIHNTDSGLIEEVEYYSTNEDGSLDSTFYGEHEIDSMFFLNTWEASLTMSTNIYGMSKFKMGKISAVRHRFSPSVSLRYANGMEDEEKYHYKKKILGTVYSTKKKSIDYSMSNGIDFKWKSDDSTEEKKYTLFNLSTSVGYNFEAEDRKLSILKNSISFPEFSLVSGYFNFDFYDDDTVFGKFTLDSYGFNLNFPVNIAGVFFSGDLADWNDFTKQKQNKIRMATSFHFSYGADKIREGLYKTTKVFNTSLSAGADLTKSIKLDYTTKIDLVSSEFLSHEFKLSKQIRRWQLDVRWIPKGARRMWSMNVRLLDLSDIKYDRKEYY